MATMQKTITLPLCAALLGIMITLPAQALRCDRNVISTGDLKIEVRRHCGEPLSVEEWYEHPPLQIFDDELGYFVPRASGRPVHMEEWIYNFGPRRLMRKLTFRDSELIKIESLDYGY